jgi:malate dehydrogenase (oxaloacetate-decarboxylating)
VKWNDQEVRERAKEVQWLPIYGEYVYDENGEK